MAGSRLKSLTIKEIEKLTAVPPPCIKHRYMGEPIFLSPLRRESLSAAYASPAPSRPRDFTLKPLKAQR